MFVVKAASLGTHSVLNNTPAQISTMVKRNRRCGEDRLEAMKLLLYLVICVIPTGPSPAGFYLISYRNAVRENPVKRLDSEGEPFCLLSSHAARGVPNNRASLGCDLLYKTY